MPVGFFTEGIEFSLPHPPINERVILLVCKVLRAAWQLLEQNPPPGFKFHSENEDTITENLVGVIESRLRKNGEIKGFNSALFGRVVREPKITNFNKNHPDKMPDILFDLKRETLPILSEQDGLFVECKPVDSAHPVYSCYCKEGLIRFVRGDYAWAMQQALMVGYAKAPYSYQHLNCTLASRSPNTEFNTLQHGPVEGTDLYRSIHDRHFDWMKKHEKACPITISHIWLKQKVLRSRS